LEHIKIITINTWKCDGDYSKRMRIMAQQLKTLAPAIIACQECFRSEDGQADTLKFLADKLSMHYSFVPGRSKPRYLDGDWVESQSGLGVLSAYPIIAVNQFELPAVEGDEDRKVQMVEIVLPSEKKVLVANTHLTHLNNTLARKSQAEALAGILNANKIHDYNIICGDFNAEPGSIEIRSFIKKAGAIDCYTAGNGAEPRHSLANAFARNINICVDHIFALPLSGTANYPEFINSGVVLNVQDEATALYPSDHFGISTTLAIS